MVAAADEMDAANGDPPGTHQGRVDNIIEMLENDAVPDKLMAYGPVITLTWEERV